jgi:hypothetical protein
MSTPTAATTSSSSPTDTPSSSTGDSDDDLTGGAQYYNYFFLLFAFAFLILFLLLLYFQRRRKLKNAHLQQHGRAALVQDVSLFPPAAGLWSWRAPEEPSRRLDRLRSACHDSVLEAGLDERGEAPPPYKAASADKAPPVPRREAVGLTDAGGLAVRQVRIGERMVCRLPPDYDENGASGEGLDVPARPDAVVTVAERLAEVEVEEQRSQHVHPVHPSRIPPRVGRRGSMRRLMCSTESTM